MDSLKPIIIVPMAGMGSRFHKEGYKEIKPLIDVDGKPMIERVVDSIGIDGDLVFVIQDVHRETTPVVEVLERIAPQSAIIDTRGGVTEGAVCTVLLAESLIEKERPLIIVNSDNILDWDGQRQYDRWIERGSDGMILVFNHTDPRWSFAKLDQDGYVCEVAEKKPISDLATAGLYAWRKGGDFIKAARAMIAANDRVNKEFYVAPVYNWNIRMGAKIEVEEIRAMYGVGTPEDLLHYLTLGYTRR